MADRKDKPMRQYKYIPFPQLRRQYRREREAKETICCMAALLAMVVPVVIWMLF